MLNLIIGNPYDPSLSRRVWTTMLARRTGVTDREPSNEQIDLTLGEQATILRSRRRFLTTSLLAGVASVLGVPMFVGLLNDAQRDRMTGSCSVRPSLPEMPSQDADTR